MRHINSAIVEVSARSVKLLHGSMFQKRRMKSIRVPSMIPSGKAWSPTLGRAGRRAHRLSFKMELVVLQQRVQVKFAGSFRIISALGRHLTSALLDSAVAATAAMKMPLPHLTLNMVSAVGYALRRLGSASERKIVT
tara:strand:+ start:385 stop:795 length:411 start_codon:yes stop_codon:yes gene_type:complete